MIKMQNAAMVRYQLPVFHYCNLYKFRQALTSEDLNVQQY